MTTLTLKSYQQAALDALRAFARSAQIKGAALAFGEAVGRWGDPTTLTLLARCRAFACASPRVAAKR